MLTRKTKIAVIALACTSAFIYFLQILIFRDPATTAFYIFQDLAFIPLSVALTTIVLGAFLDEKDKRERAKSTRMLTSSFYTQVGSRLIAALVTAVSDSERQKYLREITTSSLRIDHAEAEQIRENLMNTDMEMQLNEGAYEAVRQIVSENRLGLLVLSSNPLILEQKEFTDMIWGIFHLEDEFRLRGTYSELSEADILHMEEDFEEVFRQLLVNSIPNAQFLREKFPNYYATARTKLHSAAKENLKK